jgi:hypothetical protein
MLENKPSAPHASIKKRDPGFAQIRRGLRPHLREMSGNAVKFYLWLHLSADFRSGEVEASYEDMARALGWSSKTLQRAVDELARRYIAVQLAANQHELTRISILNYHAGKLDSGVDKSVHSNIAAMDRAVDAGTDKSVHTAVHTNQAKQQILGDLQIPKKLVEVIEEKKGEDDAVRRRFDAELPLPIPPVDEKATPTSNRKAKLEARLAGKIGRGLLERFSSWIAICQESGRDHPFGADERVAFKALQYEPDLKSPLLSWSFVWAVVNVYDKYEDKDVTPGNLCSKVIDYCIAQKGRGEEGYNWPPDFQDHRDRLRQVERQADGSRPPSRDELRRERNREVLARL